MCEHYGVEGCDTRSHPKNEGEHLCYRYTDEKLSERQKLKAESPQGDKGDGRDNNGQNNMQGGQFLTDGRTPNRYQTGDPEMRGHRRHHRRSHSHGRHFEDRSGHHGSRRRHHRHRRGFHDSMDHSRSRSRHHRHRHGRSRGNQWETEDSYTWSGPQRSWFRIKDNRLSGSNSGSRHRDDRRHRRHHRGHRRHRYGDDTFSVRDTRTSDWTGDEDNSRLTTNSFDDWRNNRNRNRRRKGYSGDIDKQKDGSFHTSESNYKFTDTGPASSWEFDSERYASVSPDDVNPKQVIRYNRNAPNAERYAKNQYQQDQAPKKYGDMSETNDQNTFKSQSVITGSVRNDDDAGSSQRYGKRRSPNHDKRRRKPRTRRRRTHQRLKNAEDPNVGVPDKYNPENRAYDPKYKYIKNEPFTKDAYRVPNQQENYKSERLYDKEKKVNYYKREIVDNDRYRQQQNPPKYQQIQNQQQQQQQKPDPYNRQQDKRLLYSKNLENVENPEQPVQGQTREPARKGENPKAAPRKEQQIEGRQQKRQEQRQEKREKSGDYYSRMPESVKQSFPSQSVASKSIVSSGSRSAVSGLQQQGRSGPVRGGGSPEPEAASPTPEDETGDIDSNEVEDDELTDDEDNTTDLSEDDDSENKSMRQF
ncbi:uncharacterized protein LOC142338268 isoform X2 [Convolutriloba macropyga]